MVLSDDERRTLENYVKRRSTAQRLAQHARIVLTCADSTSNVAVTAQLRVHRNTVTRYPRLFLKQHLDKLSDEPRPHVPRSVTDTHVKDVVIHTLKEVPENINSLIQARAYPQNQDLSDQRTTDLSNLQATTLAHLFFLVLPIPAPNPEDPRCRQPIPEPTAKHRHLQRIRETTIQTLKHTTPILPMLPTSPSHSSSTTRNTHHQPIHHPIHHQQQVISKLSAQHTAADFRDFLDQIDRAVEPGLEVHVICDNLSTHKAPAVRKWLLAHPPFILHFTPTYSSSINQVERWFAEIQRRCLDRGVFCFLEELTTALQEWIKLWNDTARPFKWAKTPDQIIDSICRYCDRISR